MLAKGIINGFAMHNSHSGNGEEIDLWDATIGELKKTLTGHDSTVNSISFSPDGRMLASGSQDGTEGIINGFAMHNSHYVCGTR